MIRHHFTIRESGKRLGDCAGVATREPERRLPSEQHQRDRVRRAASSRSNGGSGILYVALWLILGTLFLWTTLLLWSLQP